MNEKLDISPLKKAYTSFLNSLELAERLESEDFDKIFYIREGARASVIQHFEYTYELSWKMMKKFIKMDEGKEDSLTMKGFYRHAGEKGLIDDFNKWMEFHKARNKTSHTYDEDVAEEVYDFAKKFPNYVEKLILVLEKAIKDL
ncbi:MAG: nucleotidyltransferase substrate binding protein [Methanobrevibacter sp.]|jgi:nucleotidyltransferase substrate binding protein (TIGR01987 family)|nr:nucleotidyltransferase substrate binding protein [Candidatus Methanoflexus mossambicus]